MHRRIDASCPGIAAALNTILDEMLDDLLVGRAPDYDAISDRIRQFEHVHVMLGCQRCKAFGTLNSN